METNTSTSTSTSTPRTRQGARRPKRPSRPGGKLKPERVQLMLKAMPGWRLSARGNALLWSRSFTALGEAAKVAAFVAALAAAECHALTLGVTAYRVTLRLQRSNRNGIDRPLLDFARRIL